MRALSKDALIDEFCDALWLEDGLARNTLESYRRDIAQFAEWLERSERKALIDAGSADLLRHLAWQVEKKRAKPRTTSRLVSALRRFFQFALREVAAVGFERVAREAVLEPQRIAELVDQARVSCHT